MKRRTVLFLALTLLILTGCKAAETAGEERTIDTNRSFNHYYREIVAAETEDTIYFVGRYDGFIKYVDKATGISGVLCGKPECSHNSESCNAYIGGGCYLFADGGRLYCISNGTESIILGPSLCSMALDGTDRRKLIHLDRELIPRSSASYEYYVLHDGYVYYGSVARVVEDGEVEKYNYVCAFPLDPDEEPIVILREKTESNYNLSMQFYGDSLYIVTNDSHRTTEEAEESGEYLYDFRLCRWNAETGVLETLYEDEKSPLTWTMELWVTDEGVFFDRHARDPQEVRIYKLDFETGECDYQFSTGISRPSLGIADNIVSGFEITKNDGGICDFYVTVKDFEGNTLVDETFVLDLRDEYPFYTNFDMYFLGRDEMYAYYSGYSSSGNKDEGFDGRYTTIIAVALDGSGARVLCTEIEYMQN